MKLTHFGGATAVLEHKGKRMLFDPWLDDGIYHGAWYHYPPLKLGTDDIGHLDYVYISHIHEDHCSAGTINCINRDAEIIIIDREPNLVLRFLKASGFEFKAVHCIRPRSPKEIAPGLKVDIVTADPAHQANFLVDSGLIIEWDGQVIYNANDCPPYGDGLEYIVATYGKVDLAMLPYAGGSGYPACYVNLSEKDKLAEVARIQEESIDDFVKWAKFLNPRHVLPFADGYVVAGSRSYLNRFMAHPPDASAVVPATQRGGLSNRLLLLNAGQTIDFDSGEKTPNEDFCIHTNKDREDYVSNTLTNKGYEYEGFDLAPAVPLDRLVGYARARLWGQQKRDDYFPNVSYYISVSDRKRLFRIDLSKEGIEALPFDTPKQEPFLGLSVTASLLALMLIGHISWNIADAALFIDYERRPNQYDPKIHAFVNYLRV